METGAFPSLTSGVCSRVMKTPEGVLKLERSSWSISALEYSQLDRKPRNSLATTRFISQSYRAHCIDTTISIHVTQTLQQSLAGEPLRSCSPDIMPPTQVVADESSTPATVRHYFQNVTKAMTSRRHVYYPPSIVIPIQWYHKQVVIELLFHYPFHD